MKLSKVYGYSAGIAFFLTLGLNAYLFLWNDRPYFPPNTWEGIEFLKKASFLNIQPGDVARVMYRGEIITLKGVRLDYRKGEMTMKKGVLLEYEKAYLNEPLQKVQIAFGVLESGKEKVEFPLLTIKTFEKDKI